MQKRDQELARTAWDIVERVPPDAKQEFRARAQGLPALLQSSGLAVTAAFLEAKSQGSGSLSTAYRELYNGLSEWIRDAVGGTHGEDFKLVRWLSGSGTDLAAYRRASAEAKAFSGWLRRAAEACIEKREPTPEAS